MGKNFKSDMDSVVSRHMPKKARSPSVKANAKENATKKTDSALNFESKSFAGKPPPGQKNAFVAPDGPDAQLKSTIGQFCGGGKPKGFADGGEVEWPSENEIMKFQVRHMRPKDPDIESEDSNQGSIFKQNSKAIKRNSPAMMAKGGKLNSDDLDRYGSDEADVDQVLPQDVKHGPDIQDEDSNIFDNASRAIHRQVPKMAEGGNPFPKPKAGLQGRFPNPEDMPPRFMTQGADATPGPGIPPKSPGLSRLPPSEASAQEDPFGALDRDLPSASRGAELGADSVGNEVEDAALGSMVRKILGEGLGGAAAGVGMGMLTNPVTANPGEKGKLPPFGTNDLHNMALKGKPQEIGPGAKPQFVEPGAQGYANGGDVDPVEKAFYRRMHRDKSGPQ